MKKTILEKVADNKFNAVKQLVRFIRENDKNPGGFEDLWENSFALEDELEASRELRLWIGQVIVPAVTMAVALASIPEVRNAASTKLEQLKWKLKSRSKG